MRVPTVLAACSLVFAGCLSVTATQLGPPSLGTDRPRIAPDQVAVYRAEEYAPEDYDEVALLHVTGPEAWSTDAGVYRKMREEAARLGANAVILQPVREMSGRQKVKARELNLDMGREGRAIAIYVRPGPGDAQERPRGEAEARAAEEGAAGAFYSIQLENGTPVSATSIEPSGVGQIKAILPDGTIRHFSSARVRWVTDRDGRDWTRWVLDERRRLAPVTRPF